MPDIHLISFDDIYAYEISGTWWTQYMRYRWTRELTDKYIKWKIRKKYKRYLEFIEFCKREQLMKEIYK